LIHLASIYPAISERAEAGPVVRRAIQAARGRTWAPLPVLSELLTGHARLLRKLNRKDEARKAEAVSKALRATGSESPAGSHLVSYEELRDSKEN